MIKLFISLIIGYILGQIVAYRKNRKQCLNCGSYKTSMLCAGLGYGGGEYRYAVRHWEGYHCKKCNKLFSAQITLDKNQHA